MCCVFNLSGTAGSGRSGYVAPTFTCTVTGEQGLPITVHSNPSHGLQEVNFEFKITSGFDAQYLQVSLPVLLDTLFHAAIIIKRL